MVRRWRVLDQLQNRNETLFYNVLVTHITEMAPIIYTPTVGWVCMNYHILFQKPRGMYLCAGQRGEIAPLVYNWPSAHVDAIVITDGSRVLGLGDQGLNGIGANRSQMALLSWFLRCASIYWGRYVSLWQTHHACSFHWQEM